MRRSDREITDINEIREIMNRCDVCRLALNDDGYPYILPLNFGMAEDMVLYFHGALEGTKYALMREDNRASFEMDCKHELRGDESRGYCTMMYESVIGRGHIEFVPDDSPEKAEALDIICRQYHPGGFKYNPAAMARTCVFKLIIESVTGKIKK